MPDRALHGNGSECPACALRRADMDLSEILRPVVPCNNCGAVGRVGRTEWDIVAEAVAEARRSYWPAREALWARQNAKGAVVDPAPFQWPPAALPWEQAEFAF